MLLSLKITALLVCIVHTSSGQLADQATLAKVKAGVLNLLKDKKNLGGFVRLAFHDCVGLGNCDGCINHGLADNAGLKAYTDVLDELYKDFKDVISRADLYAYASVVALEKASESKRDNQRFDITSFKVGRVDCSEDGTEDDLDEHLPSSNMKNVEEVTSFFKSVFDLNQLETIALMGAHTLGRTRTEASGYEGPWTRGDDVNVLDNEYYKQILKPWVHKKMPTSEKFQWERNEGETANAASPGDDVNQGNILLNTDAALSVNMDLKANGDFVEGTECKMCGNGGGRGRRDCCPRNDGYEVCEDFNNDNEYWMGKFTDVFYKMIDHAGINILSTPKVGPATVTPTTQPPVTRRPNGGNKGGKKGKGGRGRNKGDNKIVINEIDDLMKRFEEIEDTLNEVKKEIF